MKYCSIKSVIKLIKTIEIIKLGNATLFPTNQIQHWSDDLASDAVDIDGLAHLGYVLVGSKKYSARTFHA